MKAAIALFGNRVSPRFDCTHDFMVVTVADNHVTEKEMHSFNTESPSTIARFLSELKVDTVICGGIDVGSEQVLGFYKIRIVANIKGEAQGIVSQLINGDLEH